MYLAEAFSWKNLVFLSPDCRQLILDLCLHISSSLSIQKFNPILVFFKDLIISGVKGCCKVEFIQPFNWLYSVSNLLVFQHLVTLYFGGFVVRVVSEIE